MKQNEQIKRLKREMKDNSISIRKFLILYFGVDVKCADELSHRDVKELIPQTRRISYENLLDNKRKMYTGEIISVKDCFGEVIPYIKPNLEPIYSSVIVNCKKKCKDNLKFNDGLNTYELSILCKKYKLLKRFKDYRKAYKLLKSKKEKPRVQKIKKYILEDDEYEY